MQIALARDDYQGQYYSRRHLPHQPLLGRRERGWHTALHDRASSVRLAARPRGLDVCRLMMAFIGLSLYVGVPAIAIGYLVSLLIP